MKTMFKDIPQGTTTGILGVFLIASILFVGFAIWKVANTTQQGFGSASTRGTPSCTVSTVAQVAVGDDLSTTVLSAAANRAWATIELPFTTSGSATTSVSVSFDEGAAATLAGGLDLSTTTPQREFGLDTDFPYTGAVTAITNTASTSLKVTECLY